MRIQAASVGFVDGLKVQGLYQTKDPLPFVPGTEFAGVVDAVAADVSAFKPGMPVIGMARSGALAEYISVPSAALSICRRSIAFEVGRIVQANYLTGLYALERARRASRGRVPAGAGRRRRRRHRRRSDRQTDGRAGDRRGFDRRKSATSRSGTAPTTTIDYTRADWRDTLKEMTGGHGADVIFDPVGGEVSLQAFRSIAWRGRHLVVGFASGTIPALAFNLPLLKGGALLGVDLAQIQKREPETHRRADRATVRLARGKTRSPSSARSCRSRISARRSRPCSRGRRLAR